MLVLVTGAKGMLGKDICTIFSQAGHQVIPTDKDSLDVLDEKMVDYVIKDVRPDVIIHCAAYTNIEKAEDDYDNAYKINVEGTKNIAQAAAKTNSALVYISTSYVFDGNKNAPYLPSDKPNPINAYGKTKYLGELEVQKYCKRYYIVRASLLYGLYGSNFVNEILELSKTNSQLKALDDEVCNPTWTVEFAKGLIRLFNMSFGIYHIASTKSITKCGLAKEILKIENIETEVIPTTMDELSLRAKRPLCCSLETGGLLRDWGVALFDYLKIKNAAE